MGAQVERLGRYEIVRHLASGGMAQVLLARTTGIGGFERYVLVKRIHTEHAKDERFVKMFLDEARLAAMLHHGNIVQVHEVGEDAGTIFFAMEYVHGQDVRRLLAELTRRREKTPFEHAVTIVSAVADALHHAHEQRGPDGQPLGLVHRDVTPANIIIGYDGIVKVVDFGIAKAAMRSSETQQGMLKGKVAYMTPEQCTGKEVDRRSDVFALGVVLYELVCVRRLFKGDNDFLTMSAIVEGKIPPPTLHRADLPKGLEQIILKALAMKPEDRYQSAADMGAALERFAMAKSLRTSTKALAAYMKQRFGTRPEPWLVDSAEPEAAVSADWDGEASGVASPPAQAVENLAIPHEIEPSASAPIMRARKKAITAKRKPVQVPPPSAGKRAVALPGLPPARDSAQIAATAPAPPVEAPAAAAAPEPAPSIVLAPDLASSAEVIDDGWSASDKEVTPSLMPAALAVGSAQVTSDANPSAAVFEPVKKPRTPWLRSRRAKAAVAGGAVVALIGIFAATRSGSKPAPAAQPAMSAPAQPAPAQPASEPVEAASSQPASDPPASGSAAPAAKPPPHAPAKPPAKKSKRPRPKW